MPDTVPETTLAEKEANFDFQNETVKDMTQMQNLMKMIVIEDRQLSTTKGEQAVNWRRNDIKKLKGQAFEDADKNTMPYLKTY